MKYRLALDLGPTSLGWAVLQLDSEQPPRPKAIMRAGVRIFSDGRNPKDGSSLAVTRRTARAMRRRRDRLLKRKARMLRTLTVLGFFPADDADRKRLEQLDPYALRAKGLDHALAPGEFARALFHINQRRGFLSNRRTDQKDSESGALKTAIRDLRQALRTDNCRTVGEWLYKRHTNGQTVRARFRQDRVTKEDGKTRLDKRYDLYIDRAMVSEEFDALWAAQQALNPALFTEAACDELRGVLLFQRPLKPVRPGRCTFLPEEHRAPQALPSMQRFRIYQEVNHLRILREGLQDEPLTLSQRDALAQALEENGKRSFTQIKKLLGVGGAVQFNFEDPKRQELKGNVTSAILSKSMHFGRAWFSFSEALQDEIVMQLASEEDEAQLIRWLQETAGVDEARAETIANAALPEGYGALSAKAIAQILPALRAGVVTYAEAAKAAGFHHSDFRHGVEVPGRTDETQQTDPDSGEIRRFHVFRTLPYYGEFLQRHVGFGTGTPGDPDEMRYGRIANPSVHIGLNQIRKVANALINRYGHPAEVVIEVARELKQSQDQRREESLRQAENQRRNDRLRASIADTLEISPERVRQPDIQKMILWEELSFDPAQRRCPYSGIQISAHMLLSEEVEIEHILPFSCTLDDSLNNKTVALRVANRAKGNRTPWQAFGEHPLAGFEYAGILERAQLMPRQKRYRFAEDGYQRWLREDKDFLARALNDTRHLSRVAREYLALICPQNTRVIPGRMTALLRGKFGLNHVLGLNGEKNREDHRHHAVDACVIGVTDQGMLQRFSQASALAREQGLQRLVEDMPPPWPTYYDHVARATRHIWVSHKPDHGHEGAMHNDTAYGLLGNGRVRVHKVVDGRRQREEGALKVIEFASAKAAHRHGTLADGSPRPYKGYKGDSNYCIEIVRNEEGRWEGEVISTFEAYQIVRRAGSKKGIQTLRHPQQSASGKPLVMRLMIDDIVRLVIDGSVRTMRVASVNAAGRLSLADHQEANVDARNRDPHGNWRYTYKQASSLQAAQGRQVAVSPIGEMVDPGFQG